MSHPDTDSKEIKEEPFEELYVAESLERNQACCLCEKESLCWTLQQRLHEHIILQHSDEVPLTCCFCEEGLSIQNELINHLLSHLSVKVEVDTMLDAELPERPRARRKMKTYEVEKQEKTNQFKQGLKKHPSSKVKYQVEALKIKCDFCPKLFKYKQGVQKHWDIEHNPMNLFPCVQASCTSRCKTLKNLHAHLRTHEPPRSEDVDSLQCHKCFKVFSTQKQLSLHFYTHREKFFCCDICGMKFNNREQIKNHVLRHAGLFKKRISNQRIICDQCSNLVYSHKMKRHQLIHHSDEKPFKCDFMGCSAAFSDSRILSDHRNIHLKIKPYKCEYCTEAFRSGANLRLHRIRHTDPDRYRCEECQTSFVTKQALQKHNRRHTEDPEIRPFACDFPGCCSTFKQKDHVRNHFRRTHEKSDEIFRCEQCQKTYDKKDALGKHLRKAHNISKRKPRIFPIIQEASFI